MERRSKTEEVINIHDFKASVKIDDKGRKRLCSLIVFDSKDEHTFDCNIYNELKDVAEIDKNFKLFFTGYGYSVKTFILSSGTTKISEPIFQEVSKINTVVWTDACEEIRLRFIRAGFLILRTQVASKFLVNGHLLAALSHRLHSLTVSKSYQGMFL